MEAQGLVKCLDGGVLGLVETFLVEFNSLSEEFTASIADEEPVVGVKYQIRLLRN